MTDGPNRMKPATPTTIRRTSEREAGVTWPGFLGSNIMMKKHLGVDFGSDYRALGTCARTCGISVRGCENDARAGEIDTQVRAARAGEKRGHVAGMGGGIGRRGLVWCAAMMVAMSLMGSSARGADATGEQDAASAPVTEPAAAGEATAVAPVTEAEPATDANQTDAAEAVQVQNSEPGAAQKTGEEPGPAHAEGEDRAAGAGPERRSRLREFLEEMSEERSGNRMNGGAMGPGRGMGPAGPDRTVDFRVVSSEEWDEVVQFLGEYAPYRLKMYQEVESRMGSDSRAARMLRFRLASGHRRMLEGQAQGPELFKFALDQFKLEDSILEQFDAMRREGDTPERRETIRGLLRQFVENNFAERETRLSRLRAALEREEKLLNDDRQKFDEFVESRERQFREQMEQLQRRREMMEQGIGPGTGEGQRRGDEGQRRGDEGQRRGDEGPRRGDGGPGREDGEPRRPRD